MAIPMPTPILPNTMKYPLKFEKVLTIWSILLENA